MSNNDKNGLGDKTIMRPAWQSSMSEHAVLEALREFDRRNIIYGRDPILGFPGTPPLPISRTVHCNFLLGHANNIGRHSNTKGAEYGFEGSQQAEREVVAMCADLMDASPEEVDGYISPGGTEANIVGCWIGRNRAQGRTAIIGSYLSHYSIAKAANLLGIGAKPQEDGSGLHIVGTDDSGHLHLQQLDQKMDELAHVGVTNVIIIGNAGTTMLGSVDDIPGICEVLERQESKFASVHLHIDAAFGGFVIPFLPKLPKIGFSNLRVDSITIDVHKMGFSPYGSGVILARAGLFERVRTHAPYVRGDDTTLCGSRGGVVAYTCWAVMRNLGKNGYAQIVQGRMELTKLIHERFVRHGFVTFDNDINIVAVRGSYPEAFCDRFITHIQKNFPSDMGSPASPGRQDVWNVVVMPHTTIQTIEVFLAACNA